ncbi:hypothetical protein QYE76_026193 [Lolium multiflorum]|uniref:Uncharacterized protein n=1 Tax=Lolium multiflorum TaxID=4521 RepID=A0AAD8VWM5_LOLMU|nr:hypothetical protein QYE76_026193 [Lolium multiflorum]
MLKHVRISGNKAKVNFPEEPIVAPKRHPTALKSTVVPAVNKLANTNQPPAQPDDVPFAPAMNSVAPVIALISDSYTH